MTIRSGKQSNLGYKLGYCVQQSFTFLCTVEFALDMSADIYSKYSNNILQM